MGRYFDFNPVQPWGGGLGVVGDALSNIGDTIDKRKGERVKEDLERQRTAAYKAQVDAQLEGVKRQSLRDQVAFDQTQQDRMENASQKIANLISGGRYGEAAAVSAGSRFLDPRTGKMAGIGFEKQDPGAAPVAPQAPGPAPVAPEAPMLPSQNEQDYYKGMTPEAARAQAISRALKGATQPPAMGSDEELRANTAGSQAEATAAADQAARQDYESKQLGYNVAQADYQDRQAAYGKAKKTYDEQVARPGVVLTYPNGSQVPIDPRESDQFKETQARDTASKLLQAADRETDPGRATVMRQQASMILAQLPSINQGAINNRDSQAAANKFRSDLEKERLASQERTAAGHDRARIIAAKIRGKGGGILPGAEENRVSTEFHTNNSDITQKGGLREQITHQERSLNALREHPENNTNWTNATDAMIRTNTGRAAIIAQYKLYTGKAASAEDAAAQFMQWIEDGALSPEQKRSLYGAMQDSYNNTVDEWDQAYDTASEYETDPRVQSSPALQASVARGMHTTFRGGKRKKSADKTVPGLPNVPLTTNPAPAPATAPTPGPAKAAPHPKEVPVGTIIDSPKGKLKKVGPNNWQPVTP